MNTFTHALIGNVLIVKFHRVPDSSDNQEFISILRESKKKLQADQKLILCTIVIDSTPDISQRENMQGMAARILEYADAVHLVVPGSGITLNIMRTIMRAIIVASRTNGKAFIHNSFESFTASVKDTSLPAEEILNRAAQRNLISLD